MASSLTPRISDQYITKCQHKLKSDISTPVLPSIQPPKYNLLFSEHDKSPCKRERHKSFKTLSVEELKKKRQTIKCVCISEGRFSQMKLQNSKIIRKNGFTRFLEVNLPLLPNLFKKVITPSMYNSLKSSSVTSNTKECVSSKCAKMKTLTITSPISLKDTVDVPYLPNLHNVKNNSRSHYDKEKLNNKYLDHTEKKTINADESKKSRPRERSLSADSQQKEKKKKKISHTESLSPNDSSIENQSISSGLIETIVAGMPSPKQIKLESVVKQERIDDVYDVTLRDDVDLKPMVSQVKSECKNVLGEDVYESDTNGKLIQYTKQILDLFMNSYNEDKIYIEFLRLSEIYNISNVDYDPHPDCKLWEENLRWFIVTYLVHIYDDRRTPFNDPSVSLEEYLKILKNTFEVQSDSLSFNPPL